MEGWGDVHRGAVSADSSGLSCQGDERAGSGSGGRGGPRDGAEDAAIFYPAQAPDAGAEGPAEPGAIHGDDREDPREGQVPAGEAASHGVTDPRAAEGRARLHWRVTAARSDSFSNSLLRGLL